MSKINDFFPPASQGYEHSPMMHVQDQKTTGTAGGSSGAGENARILNTIVTNEIVGASLASNQVTLPAGEYTITVESTGYMPSVGSMSGQLKVNGALQLGSMVRYVGIRSDTTGDGSHSYSGRVNLTAVSTLEVVTNHSAGSATNGLGIATNRGPYEVYTDIKIWKLDAIKTSPIVYDSKLYPLPGNAYVTGNISGLEYSMNAGSPLDTIDITAGICYDSLNTIVLTLSADTTAVLSSPTINTIYNVFLTDAGDIQFDTDVDGATLLAGSVSQLRWIGFVFTDASGDIIACELKADTHLTSVDIGAFPGTTSALDLSPFLPVLRVKTIGLWGRGGANAAECRFFWNDEEIAGCRVENSAEPEYLGIIPVDNITWNCSTSGGFCHIHTYRLKR